MTRSAILVPTSPAHFHWTKQLLDSAGLEENVIVIFSSESDRFAFGRECQYVIAPSKPDNIEAIVTHKKLEALKQLYQDYDYLAIIDAESIFVRACTPHLEEIWLGNCLAANRSKNGHMVILECLKDLGMKLEDYPISPNLYWWFNEIQIYPCRLLEDFFRWLPHHISALNFDYILFGVYLITVHKHPIRILPGQALWGIMEDLPTYMIRDKKLNLQPRLGSGKIQSLVQSVHWSPWCPEAKVLECDNIKILFHLDRYPKP